MIRLSVLAALSLLVATPSAPQSAAVAAGTHQRAYPTLTDIRWTYGEEGTSDKQRSALRLTRARSSSTLSPGDGAEIASIVQALAQAKPTEAVSFALARAAGALACTGRAEDGGRASGTCRFDPNEAFAGELAGRGLAPADSDAMLALALVGAQVATVDGLTAQGFAFDDSGDLVAVSALGVTPAYAGELRQAGLKVDDLGDLIAAKALKIDGGWLGEMDRAGFARLDVGQAIQMRALGVTPDYALRMARVLHVAHEIE